MAKVSKYALPQRLKRGVRKRVTQTLDILAETYPETGTALHFDNTLHLAIAVILSAQCTDKRVNIVTPALFERFPTVEDFANAKLKEIEKLIQSTGFFRVKAKNIQAMCKELITKHDGEVPGTQAELVALPGIGRKTANVILGDGFDIPGITVDTHVGRLSRRLGFTAQIDPVKVEFELMKLVPETEWTRFSHRLILHGRSVCKARKPRCETCPLAEICPKVGVT